VRGPSLPNANGRTFVGGQWVNLNLSDFRL
jgi:hypothetical protein